MHRKNRVPRVLLDGLLLLGMLLTGGVGTVWAQPADAPKPPDEAAHGAVRNITVPLNGAKPVRMMAQTVGDKTIYPNIGDVRVAKVGIIQVTAATDDPTTAILKGVAPGITKLTLISDDHKVTENYEVIVLSDIELLSRILKLAVPTASVQPIPGAGNTIILTGWVARSEDIDVILGIARTFTAAGGGPATIINALKIGGVMQVQLDVVLARVARSELRQMNVSFFEQGAQQSFASEIGGHISIPTSATFATGSGGTAAASSSVASQTASSTISGTVTPPLLFFGVQPPGLNILSFVDALRQNGLAKVLAQPRLVTLSGRPATFNSGGQQAIPSVSGIGAATGVTFSDFGIIVNFLPIVLGNGKIYLEVEPSVSQLDNANGFTLPGTATVVPGRDIQRVHTSVEMEPGQTLAIGGLINNTVQAASSKIPILGDLPFLGVLFQTKSYNEIEEELVVLVTPHYVDPMDCKQLPKFLPGQETRRPDDFELFLEGILESPRGQRDVCPDRHYVPAYKHDPALSTFPCGGPYGAGGPNCAGCNGQVPDAGLSPMAGAPAMLPSGSVVAQPQSLPAAMSGEAVPAVTGQPVSATVSYPAAPR